MSKVVICYSGGLDSTSLLAKCVKEYDEVVALNISYGSKHNDVERKAALQVCLQLGVQCVTYNMATMSMIQTRRNDGNAEFTTRPLLSSQLLTGQGEIPHGHYEEDSMKATVVPFRNGFIMSIAVAVAESIEAEAVMLANHDGDHAIYPDCREEFIDHFASAVEEGTWKRIQIRSPFVRLSKGEVVLEGLKAGAPLELSWSCYEGGERPCLKCGTCVERTEAFLTAGVTDPALTPEEWAAGCKIWDAEKEKQNRENN